MAKDSWKKKHALSQKEQQAVKEAEEIVDFAAAEHLPLPEVDDLVKAAKHQAAMAVYNPLVREMEIFDFMTWMALHVESAKNADALLEEEENEAKAKEAAAKKKVLKNRENRARKALKKKKRAGLLEPEPGVEDGAKVETDSKPESALKTEPELGSYEDE